MQYKGGDVFDILKASTGELWRVRAILGANGPTAEIIMPARHAGALLPDWLKVVASDGNWPTPSSFAVARVNTAPQVYMVNPAPTPVPAPPPVVTHKPIDMKTDCGCSKCLGTLKTGGAVAVS